MTSLKSYPHYEINVKDNSIYNVSVDENLPVHRPLYILRTQEGKAGVPIWCADRTAVAKNFGEQTLNLSNPKYRSLQTYFISKTMSNPEGGNGAFIVRAIDESAKAAAIVLEAHVKRAEIIQYEMDSSGNRVIDLDPDSGHYGQYKIKTKKGNPEQVQVFDDKGNPVLDDQDQPVYETVTPDVPVTEQGVEIEYKVRELTSFEDPAKLQVQYSAETTGANIYPILVLVANNPGEYGNDLGFRFFYRTSENSVASTILYQSIMNSFSVVRREYDSSTSNVIPDIYERNYVTFTANPDAIDPETNIRQDMDSRITSAFEVDSATTSFPYTVYTYEQNLQLIGKDVIKNESFVSLRAGDLGFDESNFKKDMSGYMIDVLSGMNIDGVPYDHVHVIGRGYSLSKPNQYGNQYPVVDALSDDTAALDVSSDIWLENGDDGQYSNFTTLKDIPERDNLIDEYIHSYLNLKINKEIVDKFRYPFTHIYDCGFSLTTKFAMIDFLDIRDDIAIELSTQVLFPNTWAINVPANITINDYAKDVENGGVLRQRALMMKESILKNTDCMRCSIYTQTGIPVGSDYNEPVPFTFWSAMKHAQYGNATYMALQEPRGLPYSNNDYFRTWEWINYNERSKELTWNAGLNYCQHSDMSRIFYPALRTVYPHETSVLVDQWVVDALVYTKHECRKAWAKFTGRNDRQESIQAAIKEYLENILSSLYGGKYDFTVLVYQTEEEAKIGYIEHVKLTLTFPATKRVFVFDIEVNREGYTPESEA